MPAQRLILGLAAGLVLALAPTAHAAPTHGQGPSARDRSENGTAPVRARLAPEFFGVVSEDAIAAARGAGRDDVLGAVARTGAGTLRQTFHWSWIESAPGSYDLTFYDHYVADAARAGLQVLPVLFDPPAFRSSRPAHRPRPGTYPPASAAAMAEFACVLVQRYGPNGTLWQERPDLPRRPIRAWQVWAEPNLPMYWPAGPDGRAYARLLTAVSAGIRAADPGAEVVTAGLPRSRHGMAPERFLDQMYRGRARGSFHTLGVHPYASTPHGVLRELSAARRALDSHRDRRVGLRATELGWATGGPRASLNVGEGAQADLIGQSLTRLARARSGLRLRGVVYYAWRDGVPYAGGRDFWGLHTGLVARNGRPKLGLGAFSRTVRALTGR